MQPMGKQPMNPGLFPSLVHLITAILSSHWGWLLLALPILALGGFVILNAHVILLLPITGAVASYAEHTTLGTYNYHELTLAESTSAYRLDVRELHPAPPPTLVCGQLIPTRGRGAESRGRHELALVFQDVEAGVVVRHVQQSLVIHEDVAGLNLPRALAARIVHLRC